MEKKIRGGALIARALKDKGVNKVFTLSGGSVSYTHLTLPTICSV